TYINKNLDQEKQQQNKIFFSEDIFKIVNESRNFIDIDGFEIFIYNNTNAYKHIFDTVLTTRDREILRERFPILEEIFGSSDIDNEDFFDDDEKRKREMTKSKTVNFENVYNVSLLDQLLDSFLPFVINIKKGSVVIGTPSTKYLLVMNWMRSQTLLHGIKSENSSDVYQIRLNTTNEHFLISLEPNPLYKRSENLVTTGFSNFFLRNGKLLLYFLSQKADKFTKHSERKRKRNRKQYMLDASKEWRGLAMYVNMFNSDGSNIQHQNNQIVGDDDDDDTADSMPFVEEYGKYSKLIECDSLSHVYYFDIPGYVPKEKVPTSTDYQGPEVGNSGSAPNMRLDILLANSQIFIGPWAYRNLMPIVTAMYPTHGRDLNTSEPLKSGDRRIVTRFRLFIDIQDDCTLRIPTREPSKDESFVSETENLQRNQMDTNIGIDVPFNSKLVRPYGWLDLDIKEGSSLFFDINYYPINGMHINSYTFELIEPSVTTSVNHEVAFTADFHSFIWEQNSPLAKNETRESIITQITNNSKCNLLREHINLLVDLVQDFSIPFEDVPLEDQYQNFSPFVYEFIWRFKDGYDLVISSNDENIINIATDSSENNFISFMGDSSELEVKIPMELFQPNSTTVDFKLNTRFFDILLTTPSYSTIKNFSDNNKIGRGRDLEIIGYYEFFNELNFGNIDNLNLEFNSDQVNVLFYGFVIKYFTNLYENLLGVTSKFKTAEEFQEEIFQNRDHLSDIFSNRSHFDDEDRSEGETINQLNSDNNSFEETESNSSKDSGDEGSGGRFTLSKEDLKRKQNELDIFVKFNIGDANLYFPENIANIENSIGLHTQDLNIDIRALDYYCDLQIDAEPIYVKKSELKDGISSEILLNNNLFDKLNVEETEGVLTYLNCHNHRFCAPPPIDDPYLTKWDFALGTLTLDTDVIFLKMLLSTVINFDFTLDDMDNMLVVDKIESYEVELDSFEIEAINIHLTKNTFTSNISLTDITFYYNEFETGDFSTKGNIQIDTLVIECFESCEKIFSLKTDLKLEAGFKYANYKKRQEKQKVLLIKNDSPFHRIWCLLPIEFRNYYIYQNSVGFIKPGQSIPSLPIPLVNETVDLMAEEYLDPDELKTLTKAERRMQLRKNILTLEALDLNVIKPINDEETTTKNKKTYNIIFGTVLVDLDLAHLDFISLILDEVSKTDCESILDSVYADVVKGLYYKDKTQAVDKGYNIIIDGILFDINNSSFSVYEYLKINASALTIDFDVDTRFELQKNVIVAKVNKTLKVNTKKLSLNVHNDDKDGVDRQKNMRIVLESFYYELKNDGINSIKSFNFGTLSNHLNSFEFEIICELILQSLPIIDKTLSNLKSTISNIQNRERELVLQLLIAGNQFDINYDPPVVSKLATIVRLSKTHVRENRSWRICARMRHIFNNLPDHWTEFFMEKVENNEFTPFEIASHQFFDCFKKWINIEKQVTDNTYLYKRLFLNENNIYEIQPEFEEAFEVFFKNIIIKIASDEEKLQDTLTLKDLSLTLSNEQSVKKTLKTEIGSLFGRLGSATLNLWSLKEEIFRENEYSKDIGDFVEVLISLQRMKLDLCLDEETLEIINHNTKINFSKGENSNMDINYFFALGNFGFRKKNMSLFGSSISNLDVNYSKEKDMETDSIIHNIDTDLETLNFVTSEDTVKSIFIMESTWRSFTMQKHEFGGKSVYKPEKSKNKNKDVEDDIKNIFNLSGSIKTLKTNSKFLKPLVFDSTATNLQWNVKASDIAEIEFSTQLFSLDISSLETLKHYMLFTENNLSLHRIQCGIDYEGGYCSVLSHQDFLNAQDATIFLHSPKIKILIDYKFMAKAIKKHNLSIITNVDDSENLIYPTSVPILNKLIRDGRSLSESINNIYDEENISALLKSPIFKDEYEENEKDTSFDFKEFLDKFELYFKVECGSQEVALTCEPKAKVEAILSVEKMLFKAETAVIDSINSISLFFDSEKLLSKFHHIFSNTISSYFQLSKFSLYGFLLQGLVKLKNFNFDSLMKFPTLENYSVGNYTFLDSIPLIKIDMTMESLKTSLSLDYHVFLLSEFADWRFSMSNELIDKKPNLSVTIDLEKIELYATALVTANLLSIYDSLEKIKLENLKSYYDILHDSNTVSNESVNIKPNIKTYLNALSKKVKVKIGDMYVQVAPHTLVYPQVLILENSNTIVNFTNYGYEKIFTEVEISTEKLLGRVTKSSLADLSEDDLKDISISAYQDLAKKSKGGTIVNFPSISTRMSTWKASGSNIIEFIYNSTFGGLVNIKWNLGPIGFISEIWTTHAIGLKQINDSRIEFTHKVEKDKKKSFFEEENLDERLKKMKLNDKYEYKPLVVPIIDTPNLKDLGNATPPLKWFGINKEKFPGIIYETISEPLQDLIKQLEKEYGKTLDKL
ncbi:hypothetical protein HANVADRAFT_51414, partial [Hanseniaspora valbyensis NRRL Y-1626]